MAKQHPVHTLRANLETERLKVVVALAATKGAFSTDALHKLSALQGALTAVREEIATHATREGWGGEDL